MAQPRMEFSAVVLGAPDPLELATFYSQLLGWRIAHQESDWVMLRAPDGGTGLSFQTEENYERPVWPAAPGAPQMMLHLDIGTADLDAAVAWACDLGATVADHQPQEDVRVMLDPAGHPFCLFPLQH